jgi:predicted RNase H-like HicB family nuclease
MGTEHGPASPVHSFNRRTAMSRTLSAILHREQDLYVAECPEVGTVSQGGTIEEALANLKEATELYLEEFPLEAGERPLLTTFEVAVEPAA